MNLRRTALLALGTLTLAIPILASCGGSSDGEGGEAPLVAFQDPAAKLMVSYPGTWQKTSDQPLTFTGVDEYISIEMRPLSGDVLSAAKVDEAALSTANPGFKRSGVIGASKEVKNSVVISYEWDLAKSAATGKPVHERADRYYIDLGNGRMAILTGTSPKASFDREQVRDIALTLKVTR